MPISLPQEKKSITAETKRQETSDKTGPVSLWSLVFRDRKPTRAQLSTTHLPSLISNVDPQKHTIHELALLLLGVARLFNWKASFVTSSVPISAPKAVTSSALTLRLLQSNLFFDERSLSTFLEADGVEEQRNDGVSPDWLAEAEMEVEVGRDGSTLLLNSEHALLSEHSGFLNSDPSLANLSVHPPVFEGFAVQNPHKRLQMARSHLLEDRITEISLSAPQQAAGLRRAQQLRINMAESLHIHPSIVQALAKELPSLKALEGFGMVDVEEMRGEAAVIDGSDLLSGRRAAMPSEDAVLSAGEEAVSFGENTEENRLGFEELPETFEFGEAVAGLSAAQQAQWFGTLLVHAMAGRVCVEQKEPFGTIQCLKV